MNELVRNVLMGAAGTADDSTFIEDVFSTSLYTGTSNRKSIVNGLKFSNANAGSSVFFDGSGDYLSISNNSDFQLGTGDFTVEFFWKADSGNSGNYQQIVGTQSVFDPIDGIWRIGTRTTSNQIYFSSANGSGFDEPIWNVNVNDQAWYHIAITRASGYVYCYVNGVQQTNVGESNNITRSLTSSNALYIGRNGRDGTFIKGNVSNLRIVKGTAVYTSNFTAPTAALKNITNTTLLACQSSTSVTAATVSTGSISTNGNPETSFGPFTGSGGEDGLVWIKDRSNAYNHVLQDTIRGAGATTKLSSNLSDAQGSGDNAIQWSGYVSAFNNNGFSLDKTGSGSIDWANVNKSGDDYASWSFRKQAGFFDIVQYSGNGSGSARTIDHNLKSVPGFVIIKKYTQSGSWVVYHRDLVANGYLNLNGTTQEQTSANGSVNSVSSTQFTVGVDYNDSGQNYIAYLFAGGESTADTARSVQLDGSGDWFTTSTSSDYAFGTGDFTIECWFNLTASPSNQPHIADNRTDGSYSNQFTLYIDTDYKYKLYKNGNVLETSIVARNIWNHIALVRSSGVTRLYLNGISSGTYTDTNNYSTTSLVFGANAVNFGHNTNGEYSNLRIVKGTAVYTSAFKPPTEPLKNITNTKLLCFNNSSVTGSTVAPSSANTYSINVTASSSSAYTLSGNDRNGSVSGNNVTVTVNVGDTLNFAVNASGHPFYIRVSNGGYNVSTPAATGQGSQSGTVSWTPNTAGSFVYQCGNHSGMIGTITVNAASGSITSSGDPTASTDSPFDDPEGFQFGEGGDQNIIKCGSYKGSGSSGLEVNIGWEPSWLLIKSITRSGDWYVVDSMRGVATNGDDQYVKVNTSDAEGSANVIDFTSTGFKVISTGTHWNNSAHTYSFVAIRRPDGYVGKPPELGTNVFNMPLGLTDGTKPAFNTGFPVDFLIYKKPTAGGDWFTGARLIGINYLETNDTAAQATNSNIQWDFQDGMGGWSGLSSGYQSWSWKRHAGFDVVTYKGSGFNAGEQQDIFHSLNAIPEMIWVKIRDAANQDWMVYHKGLNGGTNPEQYKINLNSTSSESSFNCWDNTAPTATKFRVGNQVETNHGSYNFIAMLFASVDGISKVGYYDGTGSAGHVITTGFTPRFLIIKTTNASNSWFVYDSVRGLGAGADPYLQLENTNTQGGTSDDVFATSSTGFTINQNYPSINASGQKYIYYAHA